MADQVRVALDVGMSLEQAWALAQFVKRVTFTGVRECAAEDAEARVMLEALEIVRRALADVDIAPR